MSKKKLKELFAEFVASRSDLHSEWWSSEQEIYQECFEEFMVWLSNRSTN